MEKNTTLSLIALSYNSSLTENEARIIIKLAKR